MCRGIISSEIHLETGGIREAKASCNLQAPDFSLGLVDGSVDERSLFAFLSFSAILATKIQAFLPGSFFAQKIKISGIFGRFHSKIIKCTKMIVSCRERRTR